jgi:hypothetical protein
MSNPTITGNIDDQLHELIDEIEESTALKTNIKNRVFNQPSLITISSVNSQEESSNTTQWNQNGFYSFTVPFLRPALEVESLQLVSSNIPNANCNIPDTSCVFWYYRLSQYSGLIPSLNNLFMVRLLPSYYKPEFYGSIYGQNVYFQNYSALSTQLALSCIRDLANDNIATATTELGEEQNIYLPFISNDISLNLNSTLNRFQFTGNAIAPAFVPWNEITTYSTGNVVYYDDIAYISLQNSNIAYIPNTSPTWWGIYSGEIMNTWNSSIFYNAGLYVSYTSLPTAIGQAGVSAIYVCISSNIGNEPDIAGSVYWELYSGNTNWYYYLSTGPEDPNVKQLQGTQFYMQWNSTTIYQVGNKVQYNGLWYICITPNINYIPLGNTFYWDNYAWDSSVTYNLEYNVFYNGLYYISVQDGNIGNIPILPWNYTTNYLSGNTVTYDSIIYEALSNNTNKIPTSVTYWNPIGSQKWSIDSTPGSLYSASTGLNYISGQYDMFESSLPQTNNVAFPFPVGIPAQPYNPNPKRLLNSILGFSWNGAFNPQWVANGFGTGINITVPTTQVTFFNRFRPVFPYVIGSAQTVLLSSSSNNPTQTLTYTADTYCNLVYSSIVSIYCDLLTAGSLDSQRVNNILAIAPLSAPLGITSFNAFIGNPILRVMDHIEQIYIELYDEFSEPFYLPNSAVVSLTFKLTYKDIT